MSELNGMYQTPDLNRKSFARTNSQTILQRVSLLRELVPSVNTIAEICCGDCTRQFQAYSKYLNVQTYRGLDIEASIVAANRKQGIACYCGDALDKGLLRNFIEDDAIFFGPPLSVACDGHQIRQFNEVQPRYHDFARLLLAELKYTGMFICICPNTTTMGDVARLHHQVRHCRTDFNLPVIHYSYSTVTGNDEPTELRLKYVELWFSDKHDDLWEVRESKPHTIST
ncbi:MAG: hypothetical protein KC418_05080 [Anaerolineales bacterium]|nr:hypothetical protein [Anaerolineales bacterium]